MNSLQQIRHGKDLLIWLQAASRNFRYWPEKKVVKRAIARRIGKNTTSWGAYLKYKRILRHSRRAPSGWTETKDTFPAKSR